MKVEDLKKKKKKPGEVSISGTGGCDPKTVQNRRAAFIREMQERFSGGTKQ